MSTGVPMLAGAKISLGGVNVTGKEFEDYSIPEAAYLVGRYMSHHAEAGGVFYGSAFTVLNRLWPENFEDPSDFSGTKFSKLLYYWLKQYGFKNKRSAEYGTIWYCPNDIDSNYKTRLQKSEVNPQIPSPVKSWCLCGAGPFNEREDFLKHRKDVHEKEGNGETTVVKTPSGYVEVPDKKIGWRQRSLLKEILAKEGLHPRDYAKKLDITNGAVGSAAKFLVQHGYITKAGNVQNTRYFMTDEGRKYAQALKGNKVVKARPKAKTAQPELPFQKEQEKEAVVEKSVMPEIPSGVEAHIYETKDGSWIVVTTEGNTYFVSNAVELSNK